MRRIQPEAVRDKVKQADSRLKRKRFYVYVLDTDYGHYVGHTAEPRRRLTEHQQNRVPSTAYGNSRKAWISYPMSTRESATKFEAAMKVLRNGRRSRHTSRFREITGFAPKPLLPWRLREGAIRERRAASIAA